MELDTGSAVTLMSNRDFRKGFGNMKLNPAYSIMKTYSGDVIEQEGIAMAKVSYKGQSKNLRLCVVKGDGPALFGRDWLSHIKLDWDTIVNDFYDKQKPGDFSFDQQFENLASNIAKINNGATNIERAAKVIGTDRDNGQAGDKIHTISLDTHNIVTETTRLMKQLNNRKLNRVQKLKMDKIKNDFQRCLQRFQTLQKKAAQKVKDVGKMEKPEPKPSAGWLDDDDDQSHLVEDDTRKKQLLVQEQDIDDDLALIREREEQTRALEGDILDVNEIFRDLGAMINDQGQQIDTIEGNVEKAYTDVEQGREQQASTY